MQILTFTLVAIVLYVVADQLLKFIERRRGSPLPQRSLVFLAIIAPLALITFEILQRLLQTD
jgi:predicted PurR-regulated permease PerM